MNKSLLKTLLSEGKINLVIQHLKTLLPSVEENLEKDILIQSGRFEYYNYQKHQGITTNEEQEISRAKINLAIIEIINSIPSEILPEGQTITPDLKNNEEYYFTESNSPLKVEQSNFYSKLSLIAFLIGVILMTLLAVFSKEIVGAHMENRIYYIILIPCSLAVAAFLNGFLRTYYHMQSLNIDKKNRITVPVIAALLVFSGGFYLIHSEENFDITVYLKGANALQAIRTGGVVMLKHSSGYEIIPFDKNGYATFKKVPADNAKFDIQIEGFEIADPDKEYIINREKSIPLHVKMQAVFGKLRGQVTDFSSRLSISNALVTLFTPDTLFTVYTDNQGDFAFNIPENNRTDKYIVKVTKNGYKIDENEWYSGGIKPLDIRLELINH